MLIAKDWENYEVLEAFDGEKIERWGKFILRRPDGQVVWPQTITNYELRITNNVVEKREQRRENDEKNVETRHGVSNNVKTQFIAPDRVGHINEGNIDAIYHRSKEGGGSWEFKKDLPKRWMIEYKDLKFYVEPTGFKHTGLFPEQAVNWDFCMIQITRIFKGANYTKEQLSPLLSKEGTKGWLSSDPLSDNITDSTDAKLNHPGLKATPPSKGGEGFDNTLTRSHINPSTAPKILNLFAYTGAASVACAVAGAEVVHVDASKGMNDWAKENAQLNGVDNKIRFITDDVKKFVEREIRRGNKYEGIIMDPPVYGRGPKGELWEIEKEISALVQDCAKLLSDKSLFFIINTYTSSVSATALSNLLEILIKPNFGGIVEAGEIGLPIKDSNLLLPCGIYGRWVKK
jgi:23S rRNA (cytosine1962-C5)-methyltransferase